MGSVLAPSIRRPLLITIVGVIAIAVLGVEVQVSQGPTAVGAGTTARAKLLGKGFVKADGGETRFLAKGGRLQLRLKCVKGPGPDRFPNLQMRSSKASGIVFDGSTWDDVSTTWEVIAVTGSPVSGFEFRRHLPERYVSLGARQPLYPPARW